MSKRQAVVIIHGIGEQKPMSTLRGFVSTMTSQVNSGTGSANRKFYSKPDLFSGSFELRRLTTPPQGARIKTDYFEYYWASNMRDTKIQQVLSWIGAILFRWPWNLPRRIFSIHVFLWILIILFVVLYFKNGGIGLSDHWPQWGGLIATLLLSYITYLLTSFVGDSVRYTSPNPGNIAERQKIRKDGIELLHALHNSRNYERIIIVGHSLGSIIGYDLIRYLWAEYSGKYQDKIDPQMLLQFEHQFSPSSGIAFDLRSYVSWQEKMFKQQNSDGNPWLISDFITLGSPLTYSSFLLAKNTDELHQRIDERELPSSPPFYEELSGKRTITYQPALTNPRRILHHACPFACTKWTNVYYSNDFVGGSLKECFGEGITEYKIEIEKSFFTKIIPFLSHTHYWGDSTKQYVSCKGSSDILKAII